MQEFVLEIWICLVDNYEKPSEKNNIKPLELLNTLNSSNEAIQFTVDSSDK